MHNMALCRLGVLFTMLAAGAMAILRVDLQSADSIKAAAKLKAHDLLSFYEGDGDGQIPGILPGPPPAGPYYWWQGGAMWGTLIDYWHYTGDASFNAVIEQAMLHQAGPGQNYMPPNWTASLGNDDQAFWGMSALLAAETGFPDPPRDGPQWLALAQAVFNTQASPQRHDDKCGDGLRWQIPMYNVGYDYKNAIANGCFFNLGARLARYTGNETYAERADRTWNWLVAYGVVGREYDVFDGVHVTDRCRVNTQKFSYNAAVLLQGAAFMYNYTGGSEKWRERTQGLLDSMTRTFFPEPDGVPIEPVCETRDQLACTTDMYTFKGFVHRWMAVTAQVAPFTRARILEHLRRGTAGCVRTCHGGDNRRMCGFRWTTDAWDGMHGAGEEMSAVAALSSLLSAFPGGGRAPLTRETGGTSRGDPLAGGRPVPLGDESPVGQRDRVGAYVLTTFMTAGMVATCLWMMFGEGVRGGTAEGEAEGQDTDTRKETDKGQDQAKDEDEDKDQAKVEAMEIGKGRDKSERVRHVLARAWLGVQFPFSSSSRPSPFSSFNRATGLSPQDHPEPENGTPPASAMTWTTPPIKENPSPNPYKARKPIPPSPSQQRPAPGPRQQCVRRKARQASLRRTALLRAASMTYELG